MSLSNKHCLKDQKVQRQKKNQEGARGFEKQKYEKDFNIQKYPSGSEKGKLGSNKK